MSEFLSFNSVLSTGSILLLSLVLVSVYGYFKISSNEFKVIKLGFYHPHCTHGGGGERVLWTIIKCLFKNSFYRNDKNKVLLDVIIYSGGEFESKDKIFTIIQVINNILIN